MLSMEGFIFFGVLILDTNIMGYFSVIEKTSSQKIENFKKYYKKIWREVDISPSRALPFFMGSDKKWSIDQPTVLTNN